MISVIAPVYNVNKYFDEFLASFLPIKKSEIELIIVDDRGSEDPKPIVDKYKDKLNIKFIINKKNIGLGFSRNEGLKHVSKESTHVMYIDSDDLVNDPAFINDIVPGKITWFNAAVFTTLKKKYENKIGSWGSNLFTTTIWGVAIPVEIAKSLPFEHRYYEDTLVNRRLIKYHGDNVILSKIPAVAYRLRGSGINSSKPTKAKYMDYVDAMKKCQLEGVNTYRFNMQEIYQYYWMWKKNLPDVDRKTELPKINRFYKMWFCFTGSAVRFLRLESLVYGRNKKGSFE